MRKILTAAFVGGLMAFAAGSVSAATCTVVQNGPDTDLTLEVSGVHACSNGNDSESALNNLIGFEAPPSWTLADKNDDATSGDQSITFLSGVINNTLSGSWEISANPANLQVAIVIKAGDGFGAFMVDALSGTWSSTRDLSHASIYYREGGMAPIPLPASALLMLGALGGLAFARRKFV